MQTRAECVLENKHRSLNQGQLPGLAEPGLWRKRPLGVMGELTL
jgi:hypothetical protein